MDHLLFIDGELVGSSIANGPLEAPPGGTQFANWSGLTGEGPTAEEFVLGSTNFFGVASRYQDTRLYGVALLSAAGTVETQRELTRIGITGIAITMAGFAAGAVILSRRVSRPLEHLRRMAVKLRNGDLASPISVDTGVQEVAEVAYALEDARVALQHTLEELRQENAWSDYLLESVVEGVITLEHHGRITFFSQGAERITGRKQEQVIGKPVDEIFPTADRETRFSQSTPQPGEKPEIVTILVDDHPLILSVNSGRLVPPEVGQASLVISFRDITNEEAIRGLLGDFLSNITHEFRTPLTALAASIELLLDRLPDLNQDELHELLTSTHLGVLGLGNLIDNLLEGASIETGRFRIAPRPVELADVIAEALRVMEPLVSKNHQVLTVHLPPDIPLVRVDPRRTTQVLVNLLSNAIKWAPQHSEIHLAGEVLPDFIKVLVTDQGPGISPEHKPDVFRRFDQKGARTERHASGTGLGLSVVKAIVESQGGSVGVEDRVGGGSVFWFTIPTADMTDVDEETG